MGHPDGVVRAWSSSLERVFGRDGCGRSRLEGEGCGIPHLAKSERDVGHPAVVPGIDSEPGLTASVPGVYCDLAQVRSNPALEEDFGCSQGD